MTGHSVSGKLRSTASRFIGDREGNSAVIFAIAAIPILSFVGAAVDYTRA
ncbi:pilus assembly protein TadG-related protein, partial [Acinetobacter baumannii]